MEETIKMSYVNDVGKTIVKDIPVSLFSTYENIGWKKVEEDKQEETTSKKYFYSKKDSKNNLTDEEN